jgi:cell division protein FtsN
MAHDFARNKSRPGRQRKAKKKTAPWFSLRTLLSLLLVAGFGWGLYHLSQARLTKTGAASISQNKEQKSSKSAQKHPRAKEAEQNAGYSYTFYEKLKESQAYDPDEVVDIRPAKGEKAKTPEKKTDTLVTPNTTQILSPASRPDGLSPSNRPRPDTGQLSPAGVSSPVLSPVQSPVTPITRPRPSVLPTKTATQSNKKYLLQAGSFNSFTEANNQRARMIMNGIRGPRVVTLTLPNGKISHRIEVGPFSSPQELEQTRKRLAALKVNSFVQPVE